MEITEGYPPFLMLNLSKEEWSYYLDNYYFGKVKPSRVVLHHTVVPRVSDWKGKDSMIGMQNYYRSLGWSASPHIYVAPDGIWLATPMSQVGVHAGTGNSGWWNGNWSYSIGVEMVGNYDNTLPSGTIWENTKHVLNTLSNKLNIPLSELLYFHREFSSKTCPGTMITKEWVISEINGSNEYKVDSMFEESWKESGGVWKEGILTPGYPVSNKEVGKDGLLQQRFERGTAVYVNGSTFWRLISETFPEYTDPIISPYVNILTNPVNSVESLQDKVVYYLEKNNPAYSRYYNNYDIGVIAKNYFDNSLEVGVNPEFMIADMMVNTANMSNFLCQRPYRNPVPLWVKIKFPSWEFSSMVHIGRILSYTTNKPDKVQKQYIEEYAKLLSEDAEMYNIKSPCERMECLSERMNPGNSTLLLNRWYKIYQNMIGGL